MLDEIIRTKIDLSAFDAKYKNDATGAGAIPPGVLLKLIFYGYHNGCISSRKIDTLNQNNIIAKALSGDMKIHWTTIADFISGNKEAVEETFAQVLRYCNELGLIGGEMFAVDGLLERLDQANLKDCKTCPEFSKCSWSKKKQSEQVQGKQLRVTKNNAQGCVSREMRKKLETVEYQDKYADRIQIVEPVFANIRNCKGLTRFTLRGKEKVNSQWLLYCMVHNLGKCLNGRNTEKESA
jgi:transposase